MGGCPGFARPSIMDAPKIKATRPYGSRKEMQLTGANPAKINCLPKDIRVSRDAVNQFRFHHGGTDTEAKVQLRWMLADFLAKSGRVVSKSNYLVLSRDGYRLHVAPNRDQIAHYSSSHRERTWEQLKLGVRSRFGRLEAAPPFIPASLNPDDTNAAASGDQEHFDSTRRHNEAPTSAAAEAPGATGSETLGLNHAADATAVTAPPNTVRRETAPPQIEVGEPEEVVDSVAQAGTDSSRRQAPAAGISPATAPAPRKQQETETGINPAEKRSSTLATAAVSILSTLVALRAARWLSRVSNRGAKSK